MKSGSGKGCSWGGRRDGAKGIALGGVAQRIEASRGGLQDGGGPCAMRGGGEAVEEGESRAAGLTGVENRGGGGGVPWGEGEGCPQVESGTRGSQRSSSACYPAARAAGGPEKPAAGRRRQYSKRAGGRGRLVD